MSSLYLVYQQKLAIDSENSDDLSEYSPLCFFDERGDLPSELQQKILEKYHEEISGLVSFENLKKFAYYVCKELRAPEVYLLSTKDFNLGIESIDKIHELRDLFIRFGTEVINQESPKRGGLLDKIFSR